LQEFFFTHAKKRFPPCDHGEGSTRNNNALAVAVTVVLKHLRQTEAPSLATNCGKPNPPSKPQIENYSAKDEERGDPIDVLATPLLESFTG